ncbi:MAG: hypothetical protein IKA71_01125, partial [Lentisphaeria bacterium]|nr:hypothetical protein [Lentisphaeria bacterium]
MSTVIKSSEYLSGKVPGAKLVVHSETAMDYSDYTVEGTGTLFTIGNDLYITNADFSCVVAPEETSVVVNGETLPQVSLSEALASHSGILLVGSNYTGDSLAVSGKTIVAVADSSVSGNTNVDNGAWNMSGTNSLYGMTFSENQVTGGSAGALKLSGTFTGEKLVFSGNSSNPLSYLYGGGAVYSTTASGMIYDTVFSGNTSVTGGAFAQYGGNMTLDKVTFTKNYSSGTTQSGGAVFSVNGAKLTIKNSTFTNNIAQGRGGAIYAQASVNIYDSYFSGNVANANYGAAVCGAAAVSIYGSTFENNIGNTGAVANMGSTMTVNASESGNLTKFINNSGYGFYNNGDNAKAYLGNLYFSGNKIGAIGNHSYSSDKIATVTFNGLITLATASDKIVSGSNCAYVVDAAAFLNDSTTLALVIDGVKGMDHPDMTTQEGYSLFEKNGDLCVTSMDMTGIGDDNIAAILTKEGTAVTATVNDVKYVGPAYDNLADAVNFGKVVMDGFTHSNGPLQSTQSVEIIGVNDALFAGNKDSEAKGGGAILHQGGTLTLSGVTFSGNYSSYRGGAIRNDATVVANNVLFYGNSCAQNHGGAIYAQSAGTIISNSQFINNIGTALHFNGGGGTIANVRFENNGKAINNQGNLVIAGLITLAGAKDTIDNNKTITVNASAFLGENAVFAKVVDALANVTWLSGAGTISATTDYTTFYHENDLFVTANGNEFTSINYALVQDGAVNGENYTINNGDNKYSIGTKYNTLDAAVAGSAANIKIDGASFIDGDTAYALVGSAANNGSNVTVTDGYKLLTYGKDLYIAADNADTVAAILSTDGTATSATANGTTYVGPAYDNLADAASFGKVVMSGFTHSSGVWENDANVEIIGTNDAMFSNNTRATIGGAVYQTGNGLLKISGVTFSDNTATRGGAISSEANMVVDDVVFDSNYATQSLGAAINQFGDTLKISNSKFLNGKGGGAIYNNGATVTIENSVFDNNKAGNYANAIYNTHTLTLKGATFSNGYGASSGTIYSKSEASSLILQKAENGNKNYFTGNKDSVAMQIEGIGNIADTVLDGNLNGGLKVSGGTVALKDSEFLTKTDTIYVTDQGSLTITGDIKLNASITCDANAAVHGENVNFTFGNADAIDFAAITLSGTNSLTFNGAQVNFTVTGDQAQSLNGAAITVDGSLWQNENLTIATGIKDIGTVTVTNNADNKLEAVLVGTDLVLKEKATISDGAVIEQNFINNTNSSLITGGEIKAVFVGTDLTSGNVDTEVQGGKFSKFFVGG